MVNQDIPRFTDIKPSTDRLANQQAILFLERFSKRIYTFYYLWLLIYVTVLDE